MFLTSYAGSLQYNEDISLLVQEKACGHLKDSPSLFASPQCIGYRGEHGTITREMCYPSDNTIIRQVKNAIKNIKAKGVFVATDSRDLIDKMSKAIKKVSLSTWIFQ